MLSALATLLITSTAAPADELEVPAWPPGMQADVRADGWTCTPPATSDAMHKRFELLDRFPQLCRDIGDARVKAAVQISDQLHQVDLAQGAARISELERNQLTPWKTAKLLGAGAVGAGVIYVVVRFVAVPLAEAMKR